MNNSELKKSNMTPKKYTLKQIFETQGISVKYLIDVVDLSESTARRIMEKEHLPSLKNLAKIIKHFPYILVNHLINEEFNTVTNEQ